MMKPLSLSLRGCRFLGVALTLSVGALWGAQAADAPAAAPKPGLTLARILETKIILLGHRPDSPPFSYVLEGKTQPAGYASDVCLYVVDGMRKALNLPDLKIVWVVATAEQRFDLIKNRTIDIECANTTVTAERRKNADFSVPFFIAGTAAMTRSDQNVHALADLKGKKIGIQHNTSGEAVLKYANARQYNLSSVFPEPGKPPAESLMPMLLSGSIQAIFDDDIMLATLRAESKDANKLVLLDARYTTEPLALMYPKGDAAFTDLVDGQMRQLMVSGQIRQLHEKWFSSPIEPHGVNLKMSMSRYLREITRFPTRLESDIAIIRLD